MDGRNALRYYMYIKITFFFCINTNCIAGPEVVQKNGKAMMEMNNVTN